MDMKLYLWYWLVFFIICLNCDYSDGKPIIRNFVKKMRRGFQKAVSSIKNAVTGNSSNSSKDIHISNEDLVDSNDKAAAKNLTDEELMEELKKMANSNSEGAKEAEKILNDIEATKTMGKSLSQAIDLAVEKENLSVKQRKCGVGGLYGFGFLALFLNFFKQLFTFRLLRSRRPTVQDTAMSDTGTEAMRTGLLSPPPVSRLPTPSRRVENERITQIIEETEPTTGRIIRRQVITEQFIDRDGVPRRRIISDQPIDSTLTTNRLPTRAIPTVEVSNNPIRRVISETREPIVSEVITQIRPRPRTPQTATDVLLPLITDNAERVTLPPVVSRTSFRDRPSSPPPSTLSGTSTVTERVPPLPITRIRETVVPPSNRPDSTFRETTRIFEPPQTETETRILLPPAAPVDRTFSTISGTRLPSSNLPDSTSSGTTRINLPSGTFRDPDRDSPITGIFRRGNESPELVRFNPADNTITPAGRQPSSKR